MARSLFWAAALLSLGAAACDSGSVDTGEGTGGTGGSSIYAGVGEECSPPKPCRPGLACVNGVCELGFSLGEGEKCVISGECQDGLSCIGGTCSPAGSGDAGAACSSDADCVKGMRCVIDGLSAVCAPEGTGDVGADCATSGDCYGGLACTAGKCNPPPPGAPSFGVSPWQGVDCAEPNPTDVRAYFEVPGAAGAQEGDFFRLPFPNDVRIVGGKLDLAGFPTPGPDLLGYDPVQIYADALVASETAWGAYPNVLFRFSGPIDYQSLRGGSGKDPVNWVDITPGAPENGQPSGLYWYASGGRTKYVCDNWLGVRPPAGAPLVPGHTYAVWITTDAVTTSGAKINRAENFVALLGSGVPSDPKLAAAHARFAPFRTFLSDNAIPPDTILNATVITVADVRSTMADLVQAIETGPVATASGWVKCSAGVPSPCPQAEGERACGSGTADYDEYHALVSLPIFQKGSAPYLAPADGGDVEGTPVRQEDVCLALTVPKTATMPAAGWPLVVFAHGTGGSFRSHVTAEVAGALSNAQTPSGIVNFAVLGIDQVQHGPRRGTSTKSPDTLFFNFANPAAARGNPLQGAADQVSLARFAASLDVTVGSDVIKVDPDAIVFYGHSQGAGHGSLALPYSDVFRAAALSGNGAGLTEALLDKTQPVNIAAAVPWVLADPDGTGGLEGGAMSPALGLLQQWSDRGDPLNFARAIARAPIGAHPPKHVFQTYGLGDHFSPPSTLAAFALASGLELVQSHSSVVTPDPIGKLAPKPAPLSGNVMVGADTLTLGVRQYAAPAGSDGHFVAFVVPDATGDVARFLGMSAQALVPAIGE